MTNEMDATQRQVTGVTLLLRLITVAMLMSLVGVVVAGGFAAGFFFHWIPLGDSPLTLVAFGMICSVVPLAFVLPKILSRAMLKTVASSNLEGDAINPMIGPDRVLAAVMKVVLSSHVIRLVMLETPGYVAAVAFFTAHDSLALIACGVSLVLVASQFPNQATVEKWFDAKTLELEQIVLEARFGKSESISI